MSEPPPPDRSEDLADFYQNAPCGLLSLAPDGSILGANATFARWTGQSAEALSQQRIRDLLTVPGRIVYETNLAPLLRLQGGFEEVALDFVTASGGRLPTLVNGSVRAAPDGTVQAIRVAVFRSPERRNYERSLQASEASARHDLSTERDTAQLREQFIAVLGHDLRNPLASIVGAARLLRREELSAKALHIIELMEASVDRMAGLIDDVMDFARGRLGSGIGVTRQDAHLEPILRHVVEELETSQPSRSIELQVDAPDPVWLDPGRIGQLVSNLLGNALTHGDPKSPVNLKATVIGETLEIAVTNAGEPISEAAMPRLFQPFFRGEVRASKQGLGLGLHIASEIAKAHGGDLGVTSDASATRFTLTMPARRVEPGS
ncbi:MAG TPA: PAS domain-containing sensor histidine kinase [Caulobacteraceae bacterium]